jgi:hypothetical protein
MRRLVHRVPAIRRTSLLQGRLTTVRLKFFIQLVEAYSYGVMCVAPTKTPRCVSPHLTRLTIEGGHSFFCMLCKA